MIVPMEKITVLIFHKAKEAFLAALQAKGVVHIVLGKPDLSPGVLRDISQTIERCSRLLNDAAQYKRSGAPVMASPVGSGEGHGERDLLSQLERYETARRALAQIDDRLEKLERELRNLAPWGTFDINSIKKLNEIGVSVRFFIVPIKKFKECEREDLISEEIARDKTYVYFVVFERGHKVELDCDEFFYPDTDIGKLKQQDASLQQEKQEQVRVLEMIYSRKQEVKEYCRRKETELAFLTITHNLPAAAEESVYILNGWLPRSLKKELECFLEGEDVYSYFSKPQLGEAVPVLLSNNRFSRLFEPITKLFDLPHYTEFDLTAFFAPFFTLFFGFCLGDAGYGLIILAVSLVARSKVSREQRPITVLLSIFGVSTFLFGLITGNFFGIDLSKISQIKKIVVFDQNQLFNLALLLGLVQIFFGMFLKAVSRIRQFGYMAALSTFGWIILLSGILGMSFSKLSIWGVYAGMGLILLFNDLKANIFVRLGKGVWELYGITGIFGDVLSYIRLFALSVSGSILGFVINDIALQFRSIPYIGFLLTFLILVIGHTGNLLLSMLSSFVHPLRLTFVEFYKNAGFEGGGKAYTPFRQIR
jgi:V/A-type H+-transporting ATPase subunit I